VPKGPKKKCCSDTPRCKRCPIRMLAAGTLPEGYTVKKRRLVKVGAAAPVTGKKKAKGRRLPEAA
jgi:hypothetical protein